MLKPIVTACVTALALTGCASTSKQDCQLFVETAAVIVEILAGDVDDEKRAAAMERYAELGRVAGAAGCSLADLPDETAAPD